MNNDKPEYITVRQVTARYGWHKSTVHRMLNAKKLTGKRDGRKTMVSVAPCEAYVKSLPDR
jgi:excisionase family DNA binding protein